MKRTLIFLSFFLCFATMFAQTQIIYTDSNGVIIATIVKTEVVETISFTNNTEYQFSDYEKQTLFEGGTVIKKKSKMTSMFPPMFSDVETKISLVNGETKQDSQQGPAEFSWLYFIMCMMLPIQGMLFFGIKAPKEKTKLPVILYAEVLIGSSFYVFIASNDSTLVSWFPAFLFVVFACISAFCAAQSDNENVFAISFVAILLTVLAFIGGFWAIFSTNGPDPNFEFQYWILVTASCLISYIARRLYFKHKEKKELQAVV